MLTMAYMLFPFVIMVILAFGHFFAYLVKHKVFKKLNTVVCILILIGFMTLTHLGSKAYYKNCVFPILEERVKNLSIYDNTVYQDIYFYNLADRMLGNDCHIDFAGVERGLTR